MKNLLKNIAVLTVAAVVFMLPYRASAQVDRYEIPVGNSVFTGPADAPITIFEFLDFQ